MNISILIFLLAFFCLIYLWIGKQTAQHTYTNQDYFLMNRQLSVLPLCMTFFATMLGGGTLIGAAQSAYEIGWLVILYPIGNSAGFIVLASGFGQRLRQLNLTTISEIFEKKYYSTKLRYISAVLMSASLYFILVGQGVAIKSFFTTIGLNNIWAFMTFWICFVAYTTLGGFEAVVKTDVVQAIFIIIGLSLAWATSDMSVATTFETFTPTQTENIPWVGWILMPLCYTLIGQDMGQRCFASQNDRIIAPAALWASSLVILCSSIAIYFGILSNAAGISISSSENILISAINFFVPESIALLCSAVIIMAVASTADSLLCAISSCLCIDLEFSKRSVTFSKSLTFLIGSSALCFILMFNDVVSLLIWSYELSISVLFVPITMAIYSNKPSLLGAIFAMLTGLASLIIFKSISLPIPSEVLTLLMSILVYWTVKLVESFKY